MLRPATDDDLERMRAWRNQDANRAVSNHAHLISAEEHQAWWRSVSTDPGRRVLVLEIEDEPCGVVTFFGLAPIDAPEVGSWGFYLDHDRLAASGQQFSAWNIVMRAAVNYAFDELGLAELHAEVLEHNEAVRAMNRRFRFVEGEPEPRRIDGREVVVIPVSLRREDRRQPKGAQR